MKQPVYSRRMTHGSQAASDFICALIIARSAIALTDVDAVNRQC